MSAIFCGYDEKGGLIGNPRGGKARRDGADYRKDGRFRRCAGERVAFVLSNPTFLTESMFIHK